MQLVLGVLIAIALVATLVSFTLGLFARRFIGILCCELASLRIGIRAALDRLNKPRPKSVRASAPPTPGTLRWLCSLYYEAAEFANLAESTQHARRCERFSSGDATQR